MRAGTRATLVMDDRSLTYPGRRHKSGERHGWPPDSRRQSGPQAGLFRGSGQRESVERRASKMQLRVALLRPTVVLALLAASSLLPPPPGQAEATSPKTPEQLRAEYIARLQQQYVPAADEGTVGSLWTPQSSLGDFSSDYKARNLNDTITIQVAVQTTAAQSGTVDSERSLTSSSGHHRRPGQDSFGGQPSAVGELVIGAEGPGIDGVQYHLLHQPYRPGDRRTSQRQSRSPGRASDFHE